MDPRDNGSEPARRRESRLVGIIFTLVAVAILYAAGLIIWPFLSAIIIGAVLVTVTFPLYDRVRTKLKGRPTAAAIVMLLGITFVLILPAAILCMLLIQQASTL